MFTVAIYLGFNHLKVFADVLKKFTPRYYLDTMKHQHVQATFGNSRN